MSNSTVYYKDTRVAPNSALYAVLDEANKETRKGRRAELFSKAESIYQECEKEYNRWTQRSTA
jgi:hypothetical protein